MLRSKFSLIGFVATAAVAIGLPAHSQQRITNTPLPAAAPTPSRPEPVRSNTDQNKNFNASQQQKLQESAKSRAATDAANEAKSSGLGLKAKKEDQLSKSAASENKKLGMKDRLCRQQCSKETGYKPSAKMSGGTAGGAGASVSFGGTSFAAYATCVKNNC